MAAKKITKVVKLQLNAGKATPAPPVGPVLSPTGINTQQFCLQFNDKTRDMAGYMIPVIVTVYDDRSFSFITKTPPASDLLKKAAGIESGSSNAKKIKVATISREKVKEIAESFAVCSFESFFPDSRLSNSLFASSYNQKLI